MKTAREKLDNACADVVDLQAENATKMETGTVKATHTPGPWALEIRKNQVGVHLGPANSPSTDVLTLRLYGGEDATMDSVTIADLRLISASPDMLAALKAHQNAPNHPLGHAAGIAEAERLTNAAISKAEAP